MSNFEDENQRYGLSVHDDTAKTNALIAYGLMIAGLFTGIFWFIGAFWAMVKRDEARGSMFEDHFLYITKVFWFSLLFGVIGFVLFVIGIGYIIWVVVWIWSVFKIVKGLAKITSNKSYYP